MGLTAPISGIERTGHAEVLGEQFDAGPVFHPYYKPDIGISIPQIIMLEHESATRYLTIKEQMVFRRALRRSVKIVGKAQVGK